MRKTFLLNENKLIKKFHVSCSHGDTDCNGWKNYNIILTSDYIDETSIKNDLLNIINEIKKEYSFFDIFIIEGENCASFNNKFIVLKEYYEIVYMNNTIKIIKSQKECYKFKKEN